MRTARNSSGVRARIVAVPTQLSAAATNYAGAGPGKQGNEQDTPRAMFVRNDERSVSDVSERHRIVPERPWKARLEKIAELSTRIAGETASARAASPKERVFGILSAAA